MFFAGNRIDAMREMILADTKEERKDALAKILPYQRDDFTGMFKELKGLPATIRFLDPPLHEFLPNEDAAQNDLAAKMGVPVAKIKQRVKELHEFNPMLGFRGCRLGIVYPEISEMQSRAVFEAAADVQKAGIKVKPEVMIPLVGFKKELDLQVEVVHRVAKEVMAEKKVKLDYLVGTMIEVPRGALTADEIAQTAEFFSFGTNDLTQTCLGMSRDDSGSFLGPYQEQEIIKKNPFATIDQAGVGQLMKIAVEKGNADPSRHQAGHLRRTRWRPRQREVLPSPRADLRELLVHSACRWRVSPPRKPRSKTKPPRNRRRRNKVGFGPLGRPDAAARRPYHEFKAAPRNRGGFVHLNAWVRWNGRLESRPTRRRESLRYVARTFLSASSGDFPVPIVSALNYSFSKGHLILGLIWPVTAIRDLESPRRLAYRNVLAT